MTKTVSIMDQTCSVLATQVDGAASVWDIACPRAHFTSMGEGKVKIPQEGNQTSWRHLRWSLEDLSFPMWNTRESLVWFSGPGRRQHFWLWRSDGDTPIQRRLQDCQNTADECEIQTWLAERYKYHSWVIVWKRNKTKELRRNLSNITFHLNWGIIIFLPSRRIKVTFQSFLCVWNITLIE